MMYYIKLKYDYYFLFITLTTTLRMNKIICTFFAILVLVMADRKHMAFGKHDEYMEEYINEDIDGSTMCTICEWAMEQVDTYLLENSTETEIVNFVESLCDYFPDSIQSECRALIDIYGPNIIQLLVDHMEPDVICTEIRLCEKSHVPKDGGAISCVICEWVISELENLISDNSTEE